MQRRIVGSGEITGKLGTCDLSDGYGTNEIEGKKDLGIYDQCRCVHEGKTQDYIL